MRAPSVVVAWLRFGGAPETNILVADLDTTVMSAKHLAEALARERIRVSVFGDRTVRLITHLDVTADQVAQTVRTFHSI